MVIVGIFPFEGFNYPRIIIKVRGHPNLSVIDPQTYSPGAVQFMERGPVGVGNQLKVGLALGGNSNFLAVFPCHPAKMVQKPDSLPQFYSHVI